MGFPESEKRRLDVWICMNCGARHRSGKGKPPEKCRRCGRKRFRKKAKESRK